MNPFCEQVQFFFPKLLDLEQLLQFYFTDAAGKPTNLPQPPDRESAPEDGAPGAPGAEGAPVSTQSGQQGPLGLVAGADRGDEGNVTGTGAHAAARSAEMHLLKFDRGSKLLLQHSIKQYKPLFVWIFMQFYGKSKKVHIS